MDDAVLESQEALPPSMIQRLDEVVLELLPAAVYVCAAGGAIVRFNRRAAELWGRAPKVGEDAELFCGALRLFFPDGRPMAHDLTPMADALRTGTAQRDREIVVERPDGRRLWVLASIEPLRDEGGALVGAINCLQDVTARRLAEEEVRAKQEMLGAVIETTPECVKIVARDGSLRLMNKAGLDMVEAPSAEAIQGASTFALIAPEHREAWRERHGRVCGGERLSWEFDVIGLRGTRRHMETHAVPIALPGGEAAQLAVTRDVTDRKRRERRQRLLVDELNHRVKNSLAIVQSVVSQTLRGAGDLQGARRAVDARLIALARAHDLLTQESWEGADLGDFVAATLSIHCADPARLDVLGPKLLLPPKTALAMAMAFHELCTNAVKYGAMSNDVGKVTVRWSVEGGRLRLDWRESGGPPVVPPGRRGFGSRLIERGLAAELRGEVRISYPPDGVACSIDAPLAPAPGAA